MVGRAASTPGEPPTPVEAGADESPRLGAFKYKGSAGFTRPTGSDTR